MISNLNAKFVTAIPIVDSQDSEDYISSILSKNQDLNERSNFNGGQVYESDFDSDSEDVDLTSNSNATSENDESGNVIHQNPTAFSNFESSLGKCQNCESLHLSRAISRLNLEYGEHFTGTSILESMLLCFSKTNIGSSAEIVTLLDAAKKRNPIIGEMEMAAYLTLINLEYGDHKKWVGNDTIPLAATLWLIATKFDVSILLIPNRIVLRKFRENHDVILFGSGIAPKKVVLSASGLGIFHCLKQPTESSEIWKNLFEKSKKVEVVNFEYIINQYDEDVFSNQIDTADPEEYNSGIEELIEEETPAEISGQYEVQINKTLREFIASNLDENNASPNIKDSGYDDNCKLVIENVSIDGQYAQCFDIDGIFIIEDWEKLQKTLKSNIDVILPPAHCSYRDISMVKKLYKDSSLGINPFSAYKVAEFENGFGKFNLFISTSFDDSEKNLFKESAFYQFLKVAVVKSCNDPCFNIVNGEMFHRFCQNVLNPIEGCRKNVTDSTIGKISKENSSFLCFANHLERKLKEYLSHLGLNSAKIHFVLRCVGSKFVLVRNNINEIENVIECVNDVIDLELCNKQNVYFDFCVTSTFIPYDVSSKVI